MIDVLEPKKRRWRTTQEKIAIVQQSFEPGMTVSLVAWQHGVAASLSCRRQKSPPSRWPSCLLKWPKRLRLYRQH